jgi:hypothetical protein
MDTSCPSCGGSGGGPFGPPGSAWDTEAYVCPRCRGAGVLPVTAEGPASSRGPGVAKAASAPPARKRRASGDDED